MDVISVCFLAQVAWGEERGGIHAEGRVTHAKEGREGGSGHHRGDPSDAAHSRNTATVER